MNHVAFVVCSNGQALSEKKSLEKLQKILEEIGMYPVWSDYIFERDGCFAGNAYERANALMQAYLNPDVTAIFDISGGDIANEILSYLDFDVIAHSDKTFYGYSDLTTIINAIYSKTGKQSVLYQIKNLIWACGKEQIQAFKDTVIDGGNALYDYNYSFVQGEHMQGVVVGGNIRCFLKLAGTPYFPDVQNKILLLEALNGNVAQMVTYLSQLKQMNVFERINGILLGTFTEMEEKRSFPDIVDLVKMYAGNKIPIAKTANIGHGADSKAIIIGGEVSL